MDEHLAPSTQLSVLEQSQPIELIIVIGGNEAKLAELQQQVASLQRKAAASFRCQDAKLLRTQLAEARAEADAHSKRLELQQEQLDQAHAAVSLQGRLGLATDCMVPMPRDLARIVRRTDPIPRRADAGCRCWPKLGTVCRQSEA